MGWTPNFTDRPALPATELEVLAGWQRYNTVVQWTVVDAPWVPGPENVRETLPPLNQDHIEAHPSYGKVREARAWLRVAAESQGELSKRLPLCIPDTLRSWRAVAPRSSGPS